jgi:futalosine hydrolase
VETALRLTALLARREAAGAPRYRGVVNIGVAGAYRRLEGGADLLDLCLAEREVLGDLGICDEETITSLRSDTLEILDTFDLDGPLLVEAEDVLAACGLAVRCGTFVTVNCVSATSRRGDQLASRHNALCENMEGAAAARVCREFGLPLLEMRCVSNLVEERDPRTWRLREASDRCGQAAALLMQGLPHD